MYKDFEDFWENSGILNTDSYKCIADTYEFNKDNIPQAFESFGRNCFTFGVADGIESGIKEGKKIANNSMNLISDMLDIIMKLDNIEDIHKASNIIKNYINSYLDNN